MPDLRGLFLRGHGGESAELGTTQEDNAYFYTDSKFKMHVTYAAFEVNIYGGTYAALTFNNVRSSTMGGHHGIGDSWIYGMELSNDEQVKETRPVNMAVRYLIRALP